MGLSIYCCQRYRLAKCG